MYPHAIEQLQRVYDNSIRRRGKEHSETLTVANNLASAYRLNGDFQAALGLFEATLAAQKATLGSGHLLI